MVVLTTHGRGGVDRLIWGSVAEQVVRNGHVPVLLVRPWEDPVPELTSEHPGWRVLVPLDGTKLAETSLAEATRLAVGGELLLVRDVVSGHGDWSDDLTEPREATDMAKSYLDGVANRLREDGIRVRTLVLTSRPDRAGDAWPGRHRSPVARQCVGRTCPSRAGACAADPSGS
ncbi:MAG: hypothetical protein EBT22_08515 [Chloroflexi bacterium]|nr:hypothetical protein [Chloroflexota bacterium]